MVLLATGPNANIGIRHGTMSGKNPPQRNHEHYLAQSNVLCQGWLPAAFADFCAYNKGPALFRTQAEAYLSRKRGRNWVTHHAAALPQGQRFKLHLNLSGLAKKGCKTIADALKSDPNDPTSCLGEVRRSIAALAELQARYPIDVYLSHGHEHNGNWYLYGRNRAEHADFREWWGWIAAEAHAAGLKTSWVISIGPMLKYGLEDNMARWTGGATSSNPEGADVLTVNWYDKVESSRDPERTLAALQLVQRVAKAEGVQVGFGEWAAAGHEAVRHIAWTFAEMETWPETGPGSLAFEIYWNPSRGGPAPSGGGGVPDYYDVTRSAGTASFPNRHRLLSDIHRWAWGGKPGTPPWVDLSDYGVASGTGPVVVPTPAPPPPPEPAAVDVEQEAAEVLEAPGAAADHSFVLTPGAWAEPELMLLDGGTMTTVVLISDPDDSTDFSVKVDGEPVMVLLGGEGTTVTEVDFDIEPESTVSVAPFGDLFRPARVQIRVEVD